MEGHLKTASATENLTFVDDRVNCHIPLKYRSGKLSGSRPKVQFASIEINLVPQFCPLNFEMNDALRFDTYIKEKWSA